MLTRHANQENFDGTNPFSGNAVGAGIVAVLVAVVMAIVIRTISLITPQALPEDWIQQIGVELFGTYVLPVELVALLLLVGMIGAIVIGKEDDGR